ncbi:hypothetical protein B9G55_14480 [Saccharibacillus sp. O16]|nr:hypothetical protein B9G55_14480 [Saccharibacillus sp. O16]
MKILHSARSLSPFHSMTEDNDSFPAVCQKAETLLRERLKISVFLLSKLKLLPFKFKLSLHGSC